MLVGHHVIFVLRIGRLVLGWDVDLLVGELRGAIEFLEARREENS
jgi:hypothetical protein